MGVIDDIGQELHLIRRPLSAGKTWGPWRRGGAKWGRGEGARGTEKERAGARVRARGPDELRYEVGPKTTYYPFAWMSTDAEDVCWMTAWRMMRMGGQDVDDELTD